MVSIEAHSTSPRRNWCSVIGVGLTASCSPSQTPCWSSRAARTPDSLRARSPGPDSLSASRSGTRCRWAAAVACRAVAARVAAACMRPGDAEGAASRHSVAAVAAGIAARWGLGGRRGVVAGVGRWGRGRGGIVALGLREVSYSLQREEEVQNGMRVRHKSLQLSAEQAREVHNSPPCFSIFTEITLLYFPKDTCRSGLLKQ